jgi:hypothetical protein
MLSDRGIAQLIADVIQHLGAGNVEEASRTWKTSEFERLMNPIRDPTQNLRFRDPAVEFGKERVYQTGKEMRLCLRAIEADDNGLALASAKAARDRWNRE